ncbi:MAG: GNAT family N-acetyltransferase [Candidatus Rokubacteria bacterium]|nr:GNAT family N-acetyltransferase [Candidatus Rokubacteria bacterium]
MPITIRSANLESDRSALIALLDRNLPRTTDDHVFDWLYRQNPHGPARVWVAVDGTSHAVVGAAAAFPRRMYHADREMLAWVLGDFCFDAAYRSLGPAIALQRTMLDALGAADGTFCYDFPSRSMLAVYARLGMKELDQMQRLVQLVRVNGKLAEALGDRWIVPVLAAPANLVLRALRSTRPRGGPKLVVAPQVEPCGDDFTVLARRVGAQGGACVQRSAEYLTWRYLRNPLVRCEMFTARAGGALCGYAVLACEGDRATLLDLFGLDDAGARAALVDRVTRVAAARGVSTLSAPVVASHPSRPLLERLGFVRRECQPVMACGPGVSAPGPGTARWLFYQGDRDS